MYPSPDATPIADGVVLVRDSVIASVGGRPDIAVPVGATVIDCTGTTVTAAFWNCHVHFTGPRWAGAASAPADVLAQDLGAMLTGWGVAHAVDTGSDPANTLALRRRIRSGEIPGPSVIMASGSFVPPGGSPYYVLPTRLPELSRPAEAEAAVNAVLDGGADAIKLFTGSWAAPRSIVVMSLDVARAAVAAAHRRGKLVFAHPSNSAGTRIAIDAGVDVLAHSFPTELDGPWDQSLVPRMSDRRMAMVPTLKLWPHEIKKARVDPAIADRLVATGETQVRRLVDSGWADPVRHRRGIHDRLRSDRRVRVDASRWAHVLADPGHADDGACRTRGRRARRSVGALNGRLGSLSSTGSPSATSARWRGSATRSSRAASRTPRSEW